MRWVHLHVKIKPQDRAAFFEFLHEAIPFYERDGETRMSLIEDTNEPNSFVEIVEYQTEAAYQRGEEAVRNDPETLEYLARWRALLIGPPVVTEFIDRASDVR